MYSSTSRWLFFAENHATDIMRNMIHVWLILVSSIYKMFLTLMDKAWHEKWSNQGFFFPTFEKIMLNYSWNASKTMSNEKHTYNLQKNRCYIVYGEETRHFGHRKTCVCFSYFSHGWFFATPWTIALQAPLSMGLSGLGCHTRGHGIFWTQRSNPHLLCLLHCR